MLSYPGDFDILRLFINCLISSDAYVVGYFLVFKN